MTLLHDYLKNEWVPEYKERAAHPENFRGAPIGIPELDEATGGARKGELVVLAGRQKDGKTTAALAIAINIATHYARIENGEGVGIISLEMTKRSITGRLVSNLGHVDGTLLRDYLLDDEIEEGFEDAISRARDLPIHLVPPEWDIKKLEAAIREYVTKYNCHYFVIDYFQLIAGIGGSSSEKYDMISKLLARLVKDPVLDIGILVLTQISREQQKKDKPDAAIGTSGTQSLATDCDQMFVVHPYIDEATGREVPHLRKVELRLTRNGTAMPEKIVVVFNGAYCIFGGLSEEEYREYTEAMNDDQL